MSSDAAKPTVHTRGFWLTNDEGHAFDPQLARGIADLFAQDRICDLGCGQGKYVAFLRERRIDCNGFDGNPNTPTLTKGMCGVLDLSKPVELGSEYDAIMSLEVAEHIPRKYQDVYLANLTRHAKHRLIMSWSVPGQAGDGHVNNRTNSFAVWKMRRLGFQLDLDKTKLLREQASLPWFKNTILVFSRSASVDLSDKLKASAAALRFDAITLGRKVNTVVRTLANRGPR